MGDLRCECGKIVCQFQNNTIVLKCRHCKRFIIIRINTPQPEKTDLYQRSQIEYKG